MNFETIPILVYTVDSAFFSQTGENNLILGPELYLFPPVLSLEGTDFRLDLSVSKEESEWYHGSSVAPWLFTSL